MGVEVLLDIAASSCPDRVALGSIDNGLTFDQVHRRAAGGASLLREAGGRSVAFVGVNGPEFTVAVFAAAVAGLPISPLNYRLPDADLNTLLDRLDDPVILLDPAMRDRLRPRSRMLELAGWFVDAASAPSATRADQADNDVAVTLFTSGTTAAPKAVLLRHDHLTAYVLQTVELLSAGEDSCALVAVPPYHVAGVATVLSSTYSGRRVVHLPQFSPAEWLETVTSERVTSAMVVPTMLARIVDELEVRPRPVPKLAALAYGGARISPAVLERALALLPDTGFTNAYGLTETSSTIAVLGPDDHRAALSGDATARARLSSAGRAVPGIELQIRDAAGTVLATNESGLLFVRGDQVSGEYDGVGSALDDDGWFPTKDRAHLDNDGYLFLEGRDDDTIIRGGENISPAEVEDVLLGHPAVMDACVVGVTDEEWGQRIAAVVVTNESTDPEEVMAYARARLRSSRAPESIAVWSTLPYNPTGKLLRREVVAALETGGRQPTWKTPVG